MCGVGYVGRETGREVGTRQAGIQPDYRHTCMRAMQEEKFSLHFTASFTER